MVIIINTTYMDMMLGDLTKISKESRTKKHRETCQYCGHKLVNIYYVKGVWKCKKCWDNTINFVGLIQKEE